MLPLLSLSGEEHVATIKIQNYNKDYTLSVSTRDPIQSYTAVKPGESKFFQMVVTPNKNNEVIFDGSASSTNNPSGFSRFNIPVSVHSIDSNILVFNADANVITLSDGRIVPQPWVEMDYADLTDAPEFTQVPLRLYPVTFEIFNNTSFEATYRLDLPYENRGELKPGEIQTLELMASPLDNKNISVKGSLVIVERTPYNTVVTSKDFHASSSLKEILSKKILLTITGTNIYNPTIIKNTVATD